MLEEVPDIKSYIYRTDEYGWFPLFKIMNHFSTQMCDIKTLQSTHESMLLSDRMEDVVNNSDRGHKLLQTLFKIQYDFSRQSKLTYNGITNISSLEMMLMAPMDICFFEQVMEQLALTQSYKYIQIIDEIKEKRGRFCEVLFAIRTDIRMGYLRCLVQI